MDAVRLTPRVIPTGRFDPPTRVDPLTVEVDQLAAPHAMALVQGIRSSWVNFPQQAYGPLGQDRGHLAIVRVP